MATERHRASGWPRRSILAAGAGALGAAALRPRRARAATELRLAFADPASSSVGQAAARFAELVQQHTQGAVTITTFPDGVLFGGDQNAAVNQLGGGALDGLILASSVYASFEPRMNAVSLPYLFSNYDELTRFLEGSPGQTLLGSLDRLHIAGLGMMLRTFRDTTTRATPIVQAADFKNLKLRVPNNKLFVRFFQAVGANPTPMAFAEVYTALQLGAIDGQENPVEVPLHNKFYEVQKHLNLTRHVADSYIIALSSAAFAQVPKELQGKVRDAAKQTVTERNKAEIAQEAQIIQELKGKGMQVHELAPDAARQLKQTARGLYPEFKGMIGEDFLNTSLAFLDQKS